MVALWPADQLNFSIFLKPTFVFVGQRAASEAGHIANTNVQCKSHAAQKSSRKPLGILHGTKVFAYIAVATARKPGG
jgi:hypothetical protein